MPADIPESTAWWHRQQKDVFALSDATELGLMQAMITITHNDSAPEMLAAVRRGPFAAPTPAEEIEYLMGRKDVGQKRPDFEAHAVEHVLSYQRRVHAVKSNFMTVNKTTPLGVMRDWWDRTEAQMRAALHAHILCCFRRKREPKPDGYQCSCA
jgi:hypothetical protein